MIRSDLSYKILFSSSSLILDKLIWDTFYCVSKHVFIHHDVVAIVNMKFTAYSGIQHPVAGSH